MPARTVSMGQYQNDRWMALVKAVSPKPINIVMMRPGLSFAELADLGIQQISISSALARVMSASADRRSARTQRWTLRCAGSGIPRRQSGRDVPLLRRRMMPQETAETRPCLLVNLSNSPARATINNGEWRGDPCRFGLPMDKKRIVHEKRNN